jgi:hypothetical protein
MIAFAAPWVLWGLAAAAIPILVHLFARREPPTVEFPAVRYLTEAARSHQRQLTIRHLVLLLLRTALIVLLVLAAAGPSTTARTAGTHLPSALVLIVDNSLSSGATVDGTPAIERLREAARGVLGRATEADRLWLVTAVQGPRRGTPADLLAVVESLQPSPRRLDLGEAVTRAREVLRAEPLPGEVVLVTDLQATALSPAAGEGPIVIARPTWPPVPNAGVASVSAGVQPWTAGGGAVTVTLAGGGGGGADTTGVPVSVTLGDRPARQALAVPGRPVTLAITPSRAGWLPLVVELAPDELRLDDRWAGSVRVAPPARVRWDVADRHLHLAAEVLREGRRIEAGPDVTLGGLGPGPAVVFPPADAAQVGALNRALAARGVPWQFGPRDATPVTTDSGALVGRERVFLRHPLEPLASGETGVLMRAGGAPWMVRSRDVILVGSRFDPAWTELPLTARFVPLLDALLNRLVRGDLASLHAAPGDVVALPDAVDAVVRGSERFPVESGGVWRPPVPGVWMLLRGSDSVGVIQVNPDPRESDLTRAEDRVVRGLWSGARVVDLDDAAGAVFRSAARADLRGPFLWLALLVGLAEAGLASWRRPAR